jgi:hypothetical protein
MGSYLSARATLCLLAGIGALSGGVAGAVIVGRISVEDSVGTAVARDEPAAGARPRTTQVADVAGRSALRQPTPWSAADARAARAGAPKRHPRHRVVVRHRPSRTVAPVVAPTSTAATTEVRESTSTPIQAGAPAAAGGGSARGTAPVSPPARPKAAAPAPAPEPAPARRSPTPDPQPTGAFDDSG